MRVGSVIILTLLLAVTAMSQQQLRPGVPAPDFAAETLDGKFYNLDNLQGKIVVMTFWSTRCEICVVEIPKLNRLAERYRDQDVVFLGLTVENNTRVEPFLKKHPFNFGVVTNSFGVVLKYADMDRSGVITMGFAAQCVLDRRGS